jgi:hypothetical protein
VVFACLTCDKVSTEASGLFDWRYFYVDDKGIGHTTCGIARLVTGALLRRVTNINYFQEPVWEQRTQMSYRNPSVLGFQIGYLILKHINRHGC